MNDKDIITRTEIARLAGVDQAAITRACEKENLLLNACVGKRIDKSHPDAIAYINRNRNKPKPPAPPPPPPHLLNINTNKDGRLSKKDKALESMTGDETRYEIPSNMSKFIDYTLGELILRFGTDVAFTDWLKSVKLIEEINKKRIENEVSEGKLITKDLVKRGVIDPINKSHRRLLTDGVKTITTKVTAMVKADVTEQECKNTIEDILQSFIKTAKDEMKKVINDDNT